MEKILTSNPPLISVIVPVYNCEAYVKLAVESILQQTITDFELIVIDDASTDGTVAVLKAMADERIKLVQKAVNTGLTNSLNMGLEMAKGQYIARMDGDDISLPTRFEKQLAAFAANPKLIVCGTWFETFGGSHTIVAKHPVTHKEIEASLLNEASMAHPSVMIAAYKLPTPLLKYNTAKEPAEDYDLWSRLILHGEFCNLPEVLLQYRVHAVQTSSRRKQQQMEQSAEIQSAFFEIKFPNHGLSVEAKKSLLAGFSVNPAYLIELQNWSIKNKSVEQAINNNEQIGVWVNTQIKKMYYLLCSNPQLPFTSVLHLWFTKQPMFPALTWKQKLHFALKRVAK